MGGLMPGYSKSILGIDLGTSTSIVSVFQKGKSRVLQIDGKDYMPSVVSYVNKDTTLVGEQAKRRTIIDPKNTVTSIKRHMGEEGYFVDINGEKYTPEQISSDILGKIVDSISTDSSLIEEGPLRYAVICVPANFTENAKLATKAAAELAGLEVLALLEEPVAASIMYGFDSNRDQNILVYDLGGGTFDVCILKVKTKTEEKKTSKNSFHVLAKEGIAKLGGDDFDIKLMEFINENFREKNNGLDLLDLEKDQGISRKKMREAQQKLKEISENAKIELSSKEKVSIIAPNIIQTGEGEQLQLEIDITREQFEGAISPLLEKAGECVKLALDNAKLTVEDIDKIIMVGGSTLVPAVKKSIKDMFGIEPYSDYNPITIVSEGAAIYGLSLSSLTDDNNDIGNEIINVVTHNLGIMTEGMRFSKIISKGAEIPDQGSVIEEKEYHTIRENQTDVVVSIFQSSQDIEFINEKDEEENDKAIFIGEFTISDIPPGPKGSENINIKFEINHENLLKVSATAVGGAKVEEIELNVKRD